MSTIYVLFSFILLSFVLTSYSERIRYIVTEHPTVSYYDKRYIRYANLTSKRYGRGDPFYYVGFNWDMIYEFHNNWTVDFYFFEFLSNTYRRGFVEMHFKFCDLIEKDPFFGTALRQGKFTKPCPFPAGEYNLYNMTIPIKHIPHNFPFTKGRIYCNFTKTDTKELLGHGHIDMEIKEGRNTKKNWVD